MGTAGQSITLANSIIGVGILAMPFCFQQCGIVLATVILLFMGLISRLCCYFLLKAALLARRRNFEFLAFHVFGPAGKLAVEVGIIGFLMGTCIAYFVVVGDLGPQIIAKMLNINQSDILRTSIMVVVSLVCVLPLGLLRNVDSLSNVSAATIGFYFCLVIKVIAEAGSQMFSHDWHSSVELWKPSGVLQCVPIFSMALFCQTQLFEIFESLPTLSLEKMNVVTKNAINICTAVYFTLGLFGYIAFCSHPISGNVLMSLSPTMASDVIKLGFVMSVAFSFPLIIFPCRASLYSLLYRKAHPAHHDHIINHSIPESTFRCMTVGIISAALFVSLLIPNIELVLGLVGSTIGVLICVVFPAACFINVTFKNTNEKILAKGVLILGLVILVLGTCANLQAAESQHERFDDNITPERIDKIVEDFFEKMEKNDPNSHNKKPEAHEDLMKIEAAKDSEVQPPNPVPPASNEKPASEDTFKVEEKKPKPPAAGKVDPVIETILDKVSETHPKNLQKLNEMKPSNGESVKDKISDNPKEEIKPQSSQDKALEKDDTIKKEKLIEAIKQNREEQKELIEEQKEILDELIKTKQELQQNKKEIEDAEAKKIAVESIQKIAKEAIKSLNSVSEKPADPEKVVKNEPLNIIHQEVVQEIAKKAIEAIEEIAEQKPSKQIKGVENTGNIANVNKVPNNNIVNSIPNGQANVNLQPNAPTNGLSPSISNFVPINPPMANQKPANIPQLPHTEALVQNQNIPPVPGANNIPNVPIVNAQPIASQIVNAQLDTNNASHQPLPVQNQNVPVQGQQNVQQIHNIQQPSQINQQQYSQNIQQNQVNHQYPVNKQQDEPKQQKREINIETIPKIQIKDDIQQNQNIQPTKQRPHSHSPDEPQSYKQGEDSRKQAELTKIASNVPVALDGNAQEIKKEVNEYKDTNVRPIEIKDTQNSFNKIQLDQNNGANKLELNGVQRQKREVIDCSQTTSLGPQEKEICKVSDNMIEVSNKIEKKSEEILPLNVDLAEVGLKSIPLDVSYHGRSLKSIDEKLEKKK